MNRWIIVGLAVQAIGQLAITYLPAMNAVFGTAPIGADVWLRILAIAAATSLIVAVEKRLRNRPKLLEGARRAPAAPQPR